MCRSSRSRSAPARPPAVAALMEGREVELVRDLRRPRACCGRAGPVALAPVSGVSVAVIGDRRKEYVEQDSIETALEHSSARLGDPRSSSSGCRLDSLPGRAAERLDGARRCVVRAGQPVREPRRRAGGHRLRAHPRAAVPRHLRGLPARRARGRAQRAGGRVRRASRVRRRRRPVHRRAAVLAGRADAGRGDRRPRHGGAARRGADDRDLLLPLRARRAPSATRSRAPGCTWSASTPPTAAPASCALPAPVSST